MLRLVFAFVLTFVWGMPAMGALRPEPLDYPLRKFHLQVLLMARDVHFSGQRLGLLWREQDLSKRTNLRAALQ